MDIQVASNFERYLYYRLNEDPARLKAMMENFTQTQRLQVELDASGSIDSIFKTGRGDTASTLQVIKRYQAEQQYVLDPHTAVGVWVAEQQRGSRCPGDLSGHGSSRQIPGCHSGCLWSIRHPRDPGGPQGLRDPLREDCQ